MRFLPVVILKIATKRNVRELKERMIGCYVFLTREMLFKSVKE